MSQKSPLELLCEFISAGGVIAGLFYTGYQIRTGADQLRAATLYTIQKDGRELSKELFAEQPVYAYVFENAVPANGAEKTLFAGKQAMRQIMRYYSAVHAQMTAELINTSYFTPINEEMCRFMRLPAVQSEFESRVDTLSYTEAFRAVIKACFARG